MHNAAEWGKMSEEERKQVTDRHVENERECKGSAGNFFYKKNITRTIRMVLSQEEVVFIPMKIL